MNFLKFLPLVEAVANLSKDRSTKVGAVAIGPEGDFLALGYNGLPRGVDDTREELHTRPTKYIWTEHAERNLVYNAARNGVSLKGSTVIIHGLHPCADCARALVQAGVVQVICPDTSKDPRWAENAAHGRAIMKDVGIKLLYV